jgi:hypothetical protein
MPISAKAQVEKRRTITLDVDGEPLTVTYRPYATKDHRDLMARAEADGSGGDVTMVAILAEVLIDWDMQTAPDDPTPYPTDAAHLEELPAEFIKAVWQGINGINQSPKGRRSPNSDAISPPAGSLAASPNGTP